MGTIVSKCCTSNNQHSNAITDFPDFQEERLVIRKRGDGAQTGNKFQETLDTDPLADFQYTPQLSARLQGPVTQQSDQRLHESQEIDENLQSTSSQKGLTIRISNDYQKASLQSLFSQEDQEPIRNHQDQQNNQVQDMLSNSSQNDFNLRFQEMKSPIFSDPSSPINLSKVINQNSNDKNARSLEKIKEQSSKKLIITESKIMTSSAQCEDQSKKQFQDTTNMQDFLSDFEELQDEDFFANQTDFSLRNNNQRQNQTTKACDLNMDAQFQKKDHRHTISSSSQLTPQIRNSQSDINTQNYSSAQPSSHHLSTKNIQIYKHQTDSTCFYQLSSGVYVHEQLVNDIIDRKFLQDQIAHRQFVFNINDANMQSNNKEQVLNGEEQTSQQSNSYNNGNNVTIQIKGVIHEFEIPNYYGKNSSDKLVIKAFFFDTDDNQNSKIASQNVVYQSQVLKVIDNHSQHPEIEEEIIIVDQCENSEIPIGYLVFQKVPAFTLYQVIRDGWMPSIRSNQDNQRFPSIDIFTKEKFLNILLQLQNILSHLHAKGFGSFQSLLAENIYVDLGLQSVKFMSPLIQYLKPENIVKGSYTTSSLIHELGKEQKLKKKQLKVLDQKQFGQLLYNLSKTLQVQDPWVGHLIKDLIDDTKQISLIQKKFEYLLVEKDPFFYYRLASQFQIENKLQASLDSLAIYDYTQKQSQKQEQAIQGQSTSKFGILQQILSQDKNQVKLALIYKMQGELQRDFTLDLNKALSYTQKALNLLNKYSQSQSEYKNLDQNQLYEIKAHIQVIKNELISSSLSTQSINKHQKHPINHLISDTLLNIGQIYQQKKDLLRAQLYYLKSYKQKLRLEGNLSKQVLKPLVMIANLYAKEIQGQEKLAVQFYKKSIKILEQQDNYKDKLELLQLYTRVAQLNKVLNLPHKSIKYNQKAIDTITLHLIIPTAVVSVKNSQQVQQIQQLKVQLASLYNSQGTLFAQTKNYEQSLLSLEKSLDLNLQIHGEDSQHMIMPLINLGSANLKISNFQKSIELIEKAIQLKETLNFKQKPEQVIIDKLKLCEGYKGLENYEKCIQIYEELIKFTSCINLPNKNEQIASFYDNQARLYYLLHKNQTLRVHAFDKISKALELYVHSSSCIDKYSDIYIKALLFKGFVIDKSDKNGVSDFQKAKSQVLQLLREIFTHSDLFEEYSELISQEIFEDEETLSQLIHVCGPFKNEELFLSSRAKEKWRMLVLENNNIDSKNSKSRRNNSQVNESQSTLHQSQDYDKQNYSDFKE
eukprot:403343462